MARGTSGKPYENALKKAPKFADELSELPFECVTVISRFIKPNTTQDQLHDMIVCCLGVQKKLSRKKYAQQAEERIEERLRSIKRENNQLYNPYRNISFNQCFSDSKTPVSEWLDTSKYRDV